MPVVEEGRTPLGLRRKNFQDKGAFDELKRVFKLVEDVLTALAVGVNSHELIAGCVSRGDRSSDPPAPTEGNWVMWMSDGTGTGKDGDLMLKKTFGGLTQTVRVPLELILTPVDVAGPTDVGAATIKAIDLDSTSNQVCDTVVETLVVQRRSATGAWYMQASNIEVTPSVQDAVIWDRTLEPNNISSAASLADAPVAKV